LISQGVKNGTIWNLQRVIFIEKTKEKRSFFEIEDFVICAHFGTPFGPFGAVLGLFWRHVGHL
jgi:hypothetical protein